MLPELSNSGSPPAEPGFTQENYFCGDIFLEKVYEKLNNKNDSKFLDLFSNIIEDLLSDLRSGKEKPIIRIMGKDGVFRNIIDGENPDN
jgi:hypothetical protein